MRPELLATGLIVIVLAGGLYLLVIPILYAWSIPLAVAGLVMVAASFFLPPGTGPVQPPEGFRFCVFCSNTIPLTAERCPRCNGLQPKK